MKTAIVSADFDRRCAFTYAYFRQDKLWLPNGKPPVQITDMDAEWRYNASRWLERRARHFEAYFSMGEIFRYAAPLMREVIGEDNGEPIERGPLLSEFDLMGDSASDAFEEWQDARRNDPLMWLRTTALYRALVADLPAKPKKLAKLADRARHYSRCQIRNGGDECTCRSDDSPEWTL